MGSENKKFLLPGPVFAHSENSQMRLTAPHFLTPQGMLLPKQMQPPPMYGPRGPTIPPKYFKDYGKQAMIEHVKQKDAQYFCDVCDWSFNNLQDFEKHNKEHRECGIDGCTFFAHSTVIRSHIEQQHKTGLYESIKKLSTPEEIAAWREERKKRYPTKANVVLRQRIQQEKFKRGEKLSKPKNRFGPKSDRDRAVNRTEKSSENRKRKNGNQGKSKKRGEKEIFETKPQEKPVETISQDNDTEEPPIKLFAGTGSLEDYAHKKPKTKKNVLSSLIGMYGSDDDSNEDSCDEEQINSPKEVDEQKEKVSGSADQDAHKNTETPLICDENEADGAAPFTSMVNETSKNKEIDEMIGSPKCSDNEAPEAVPFTRKVEVFNEEINIKNDSNNEAPEEVPFTRKVEVFNEEVNMKNESDNEAPDEVPFTRKVEVFNEEVNVKNENKQISGENSKVNEESSKKPTTERKSKKKNKVQIKKSGLDYSKLCKSRQNTLLEKLLQPEIIHERNVLLQCVRFVVENNFFSVDTKCEKS